VARLARSLVQGQSAQARALSAAAANPEPIAPTWDKDAPLPAYKDGKVLHPDLLNANMRKTQYAVRGELYLKAEQLKNAGKEIIFTNGGLCAGADVRGAATLLPRCLAASTPPPAALSFAGPSFAWCNSCNAL